MPTISTIDLIVPPPAVDEIGAAYARLMLGVGQKAPNFVADYWGPQAWLDAVLQTPPTWENLRQHAVAVATAAQQSDLPRNRRERILRNVRAALWLIRSGSGESMIFSEQVRMLIDLQPQGAEEGIFDTALQTLDQLLPNQDEELADRWSTWQAQMTLPAIDALPFLKEALETFTPLAGDSSATLNVALQESIAGDDPISYQRGTLAIDPTTPLRIDRLFHEAARWQSLHLFESSLRHRYDQATSDAECALRLNLGPDQVLINGLPQLLLNSVDLYESALPALLNKAGFDQINQAQLSINDLRAIHIIENAMQWVRANVALMLHAEGLRPRAVRRHLSTAALLDRETADATAERLADPLVAAQTFAIQLGASLVPKWMEQNELTITELLADPPVPSSMMFDVKFADQ